MLGFTLYDIQATQIIAFRKFCQGTGALLLLTRLAQAALNSTNEMLRIALNGGQRGTEFMGDDRYKLVLKLFYLFVGGNIIEHCYYTDWSRYSLTRVVKGRSADTER